MAGRTQAFLAQYFESSSKTRSRPVLNKVSIKEEQLEDKFLLAVTTAPGIIPISILLYKLLVNNKNCSQEE